MAKTTLKSSKPASPKPIQWDAYLWLGIPFLASILVYIGALSNDFVEWDDNRYVYDNPELGKWNLNAWKYFLGKYVMGNWHPLTMMSLSLDKTLFGLDPSGFHATNLFFHGINSALVALLAFKLLNQKNLAILAGLLFAVHPLHTESVAWVSERKDVLYTLGTLAALSYWHSWLKSEKQNHLGYAFLFFALACLAKAQAVVMPMLALLITAWEKPDFFKDKKHLLSLAPFFLMALVIGIVAIDAQRDGGNVRVFRDYTWLEQFLIAIYGLFLYLYKTLVPIQQSAYYPYPVKTEGLLEWSYYVAPVVLAGMIWLTLKFSRNQKIVWFGAGFFLIAILPVLQILPVGETMISERYYYLPSAGLFILMAWALIKLPIPQQAQSAISALLILGFGFLCYNRVGIWNNTYSLFLDVMHKHENVPVAYNNIANQFSKDKKYALAIPLYHKALSIRPTYAIGWHNLGNNYTHLNQYTKALYAFEEYLKIRPDDEVVFKKIGTVYSKMGGEAAAANRIPEAEAYLLKAIEHDPDLHECYVNLGNIAAMKQDFATAESRYNTALQINPENSGTWFNLGLMRLQSGNQAAGLEAIRKAASLGNQQAGQWLSQFSPQP